MRFALARFVLALALVLLALGARAAVEVRVAATDPPAEATLGRGEQFSLRIQYTSDQPLRIWARPYLKGSRIDKGRSNASPELPAGSGYALGWFEFDEPVEIDEVQILVADAPGARERSIASYPVRLAWTGQPAPARQRADWVAPLGREAQAVMSQAARAQSRQPMSVGDTALVTIFPLAVIALLVAGFVAPLWAMRNWEGGWRLAAVAPLAVFAFVVLRIIAGVWRDPTSHNLWPFEILMYGAGCGAAMLLLWGARWAVRRYDV